jgi:hypothetical protein
MERNNNNDNPRIPENDPSKAMDSKREVEQSNDQKTDQDFPGYPHYPAKEDMMDKRSGSEKADLDVENLASGRTQNAGNQRSMAGQDRQRADQAMTPQPGLGDDDLSIKMGTDADVDDDDLEVLNATNDEIGTPQNVSNEDLESELDIPGSELDDANEAIGEEDEENNYYSLGGDRHEAQEEDPESDPVRG